MLEIKTPLLMTNERSNIHVRYVGNFTLPATAPIGRKSNGSLKAPTTRQYLMNLSPIMVSSWCNMTLLLREAIPIMIHPKLHRPMC